MSLLLLASAAFATVPADHSVGFGVGVAAPTGTLAPNTVSARIKAMDTLVIEPTVDGSFDISSSLTDIGGTELRSRTTTTTLGAGLGLRYHVASRDPVALVFTFTPFARFDQTANDPDVDTNDDITQTTTLTAGGAWGLGAVFHPGGPWTLSSDVSNPFASYSRTAVKLPTDDVTATNSLDFGLIFAPTVRFMAHLWF